MPSWRRWWRSGSPTAHATRARGWASNASMKGLSPESPEARAGRLGTLDRARARFGVTGQAFEVIRRIIVGVYSDGFIHAGNLAYLTLLTLFPFFIVMTKGKSVSSVR